MSDATDGIVLVDKPTGWTSHDVVARVRKLAATRRVGHAGTLDPMATGVLVVGVGKATRLLGHLALTDKDYAATIRLGVTTTTDDAEGDVVAEHDASAVADDALRACMAHLTGEIEQVPSSVSAIKVGGVPAYKKVRQGETVALQSRHVTVSRFDVVARRGPDVDVVVTCSSGTYVRALARDLGASLGVGAHLTALRRTRSGSFREAGASTLEQLEEAFSLVPLRVAVADAFPCIDVDNETRQRLIYGQRVELPGIDERATGIFGPDGEVVAIAALVDGVPRSLAVFVG
ncbi:MAG: tRNA pseudouridine(55) synthase TruB [Actinomycetes bacterium]